jgi:hypothetical protein
MNGLEHPNQTESLQEIQDNPTNTKGSVLRGSRRGFLRLIGAAALATTVPAKAGDLSVFGKQVAAGIFNRAGSEYGVSVRPSPSGNGKPEFNFDMNQAVRMAEQRKIEEQQAQRQRAFEEVMRQPTQISFDDIAKAAFEQNGLDMKPFESEIRIFHPSNFEGGYFFRTAGVKYTSIGVSQPATNIFLVTLSYMATGGAQKGFTGRGSVALRFDPNKKEFKEIKQRS